jgi:histidyl-tRNA synthetase
MLGETADRFAHVVATFERVRRLYGFHRIEVPVIEPTAVFARSLGETTDVVSKEMYSFEDRGGESITLRPEFTAGICRAFLTEGWQQHAPLKVGTHGPLFRYERPQKGRYRQFHQIDAEIIGASEPAADVELLVFADQLLRELGISDGVTLRLNTLGDGGTRAAWRAACGGDARSSFSVMAARDVDDRGCRCAAAHRCDLRGQHDRGTEAEPAIGAEATGTTVELCIPIEIAVAVHIEGGR